MPLPSGTRLGPYEISGVIGAGGMGEVYRARDTRLGRDVAIKVLPPDVAGDAERLGRFEDEARAAAALNHGNILAIHDVGTENGVSFMVSELLEGQTLRQVLEAQALSVSRAIDLAGQIADGLAAAHARALVHRDLKPENIFVTTDGRAKILDFGLAKSVAPEAAGLNAPTRAATAPHMVLGTAGYMSPEQVKGQPADHRSDVFAFGCVLYEMLAGRRAFGGDSTMDAMTAILREAPAPPTSTAVRPIPPALTRIVERCLEKSPPARFQSTTDLAFALKSLSSMDSGVTTTASNVTPALPVRSARWSTWLPWSVAALAVLVAAGVGWQASRVGTPDTELPPLVRLPLPLPDGAGFGPGAPISPFPALSPDGRYLAMALVKGNDSQSGLWLHAMKGLETRPLTGPVGASLPFWSPDGRSIAFLADTKLKRVDIQNGVLQDITDSQWDSSVTWGGGAWGPDGTIVIGGPEGLDRVPASGGTKSPLTRLDAGRKETTHRHPSFLPDGRHFLFQVMPAREIWIGSLDEPGTTRLLSADSKAVYAPPGWLLFVRQNTLFAQRFDARTRQLSGEQIAIVEDVRTNEVNGRSAFTVSANGVLAYRAGDVALAGTLTWLDRTGKTIAVTKDLPAAYNSFQLLPGERFVLGHIHDDDQGGGDLWLIDLERGSRVRVTSDPGHDAWPAVSPDGARVAWMSDRDGIQAIYERPVTGPGEEHLWIKLGVPLTPTDLSKNWVVFTANDPQRRPDIWVAPVSDVAKRQPYLQTNYSESSGRLSPDERWMAYSSNETGATEVYVRPFPDARGGVSRVSGTEGGGFPMWRADGRELFYFTGRRLMAVSFDGTRAQPVIGQPQTLFEDPDANYRYLVAARDGQRFLVSRRPLTGDAPLMVVTNWLDLLSAK